MSASTDMKVTGPLQLSSPNTCMRTCLGPAVVIGTATAALSAAARLMSVLVNILCCFLGYIEVRVCMGICMYQKKRLESAADETFIVCG